MTAVIEATDLVKLFPAGGRPLRAVDEVSLRVEPGEIVSVMGPSGCGKSTLLHLLGGLFRPDAGRVTLDGENTAGWSQARWARTRRRRIGFVFQAFHLVDELTAVENVELAALLVGTGRTAARCRTCSPPSRCPTRRAGRAPAIRRAGRRRPRRRAHRCRPRA